jgi:hypothetical protein
MAVEKMAVIASNTIFPYTGLNLVLAHILLVLLPILSHPIFNHASSSLLRLTKVLRLSL